MSHMNRRRFVIAMSAAAAGAYLPFSTRAQGRRPDSITVRDPGGSYVDAFREAFYLPFETKTGIKVVPAVAAHNPTAQIKALVEAKSYTWAVALIARTDEQRPGESNQLEPTHNQGSAKREVTVAYHT